MDEPSIDGINTYVVTRAVAAAGIKVALSGLGRRELFLGYGHRARFPTMARLAALPVPRPVHSFATKAAGLTAPAKTKWERLFADPPESSDPFATAYVAERSVFSQSGMERLIGGSPDRRSYGSLVLKVERQPWGACRVWSSATT